MCAQSSLIAGLSTYYIISVFPMQQSTCMMISDDISIIISDVPESTKSESTESASQSTEFQFKSE